MRHIALIPAKGIGDALIALCAAYHHHLLGDRVTLFHDQISSLSSWFPHYQFSRYDLGQIAGCDHLIAQNDNSSRIDEIRTLHHPSCQFLYPTYETRRHPPLGPIDCVFDKEQTMVDNFAHFFPLGKQTGCTPPGSLVWRKFPKRIALHPLSAVASKNWPKKKFIQLSQKLAKKGFSPFFIVSPQERDLFPESPLFSTLADAAAFLYESGGLIGNDSSMGHLASLLGLPTWTIGGNEKLLRLWRPGWGKSHLITPPRWIPNLKGLRLREKEWHRFISPSKVYSNFSKYNLFEN